MEAYRFEVLCHGEIRWAGHGITYETQEAAETAARDLFSRWLAVKEYRVVPANHPRKEVYNGKAD